ncbi:hypothetical protein Q9966_007909 [Columba livia]|nr:hypothetical protein Q9966_007909 [Columba livia]
MGRRAVPERLDFFVSGWRIFPFEIEDESERANFLSVVIGTSHLWYSLIFTLGFICSKEAVLTIKKENVVLGKPLTVDVLKRGLQLVCFCSGKEKPFEQEEAGEEIVIQHHLWKNAFFLTLQLLPHSHQPISVGPLPSFVP